MLIAFGIADRLIAVGDYDRVPPEYGEKPRIGGLLNPNVEKIIEYRPDLVITYGTQEALEQRLGALGIRIHPFVLGNVEETLAYMKISESWLDGNSRRKKSWSESGKPLLKSRQSKDPNTRRSCWYTTGALGMLGLFTASGRERFSMH
jgi:hypothetical protein